MSTNAACSPPSPSHSTPSNRSAALLAIALGVVWFMVGASKAWGMFTEHSTSSVLLWMTSVELVVGAGLIWPRTRPVALPASTLLAAMLLAVSTLPGIDASSLDGGCGCLGKIASLNKSSRTTLAIGLLLWSLASLRLQRTRSDSPLQFEEPHERP